MFTESYGEWLHPISWDGPGQKVMCRDMAGLPPGTLYHLTLPVMTSSSPQSHWARHKRNREGRCAHTPGFHGLQPGDVQESSAMFKQPGFPKGHWMECGTLSFESETVCVNSAIFLCQPSVLRQHRKSGWRVCNTDHTGLGKGLCSRREPCRSLVSVVKGLLHRRAGSSPCLKTLPVWIRGPWACQQHLSLRGIWCSSPGEELALSVQGSSQMQVYILLRQVVGLKSQWGTPQLCSSQIKPHDELQVIQDMRSTLKKECI